MPSFSEIGVRKDIQDTLAALGYECPTPVQAQTIPLLLAETRDLVALAQTGTGKTAAFGVPLIQLTDPRCNQVQGLVLCPTRELCVQVAADMADYANGIPGFSIVSVYGGASILTQIHALRRGAQIVVATPGRLNDLIRRDKVDLSGIRFLVLDEADEMLQMGFQDELNAILEKTPSSKTTLLFSATMPPELSRIAARYLKNPLEIIVGKKNAGAENIQHLYYLVHAKHRYETLKRIADLHPDIYAIIFCRTRQETREVAESLMKDGYNADALHGDLSQSQRDWVMQRFRNRSLQLLVATDVAARGLDVDDLTHVINYTLPDENSVYTHRSGRTGRAGKAGISIAIINMREKHKVREIEKKLGKTFQQSRVPSGSDIFRQQALKHLSTLRQVVVEQDQMNRLMPDFLEMLHAMDREEVIKRFMSLELNKFLSYYKNAPDLNVQEKEGPKYKPSEPKYKASEPRKPGLKKAISRQAPEEQFARFTINVGKKDGVNPGRLIGRINDMSGRDDIRIGRIDILPEASLLEAEGRYTHEVLEAFSGLMINGKHVSIELAGGHRKKAERAGASRKSYKASK